LSWADAWFHRGHPSFSPSPHALKPDVPCSLRLQTGWAQERYASPVISPRISPVISPRWCQTTAATPQAVLDLFDDDLPALYQVRDSRRALDGSGLPPCGLCTIMKLRPSASISPPPLLVLYTSDGGALHHRCKGGALHLLPHSPPRSQRPICAWPPRAGPLHQAAGARLHRPRAARPRRRPGLVAARGRGAAASAAAAAGRGPPPPGRIRT
jgi:hypothetical protein